MKYVILGGVASGTKAAAKLKRQNRDADVEIYTMSEDISYAGCGLPYYVGNEIEERKELVVNSPEAFTGLTDAKVFILKEAIHVDPKKKVVTIKDLNTEETSDVSYDELIIATGASPIVPPLKGTNLNGLFKVRTVDDAVNMREYINKNKVKEAVVVGAGFIGIEMAENLMRNGIKVTIIDMGDQILPNILDKEMALLAQNKLERLGLRVLTSVSVTEFLGDGAVNEVVSTAGNIKADMVILSIGVRPNTRFLEDTGIEMFKGTIITDEYQRTNVPHIYSVGDCAMVKNFITGKPQWSPMGSTANITGRCLANNLTGTQSFYRGVLGTGVVKLAHNLNVGRTGLTEKQALGEGLDVETVTCVVNDKAHYYPGADDFIIKLIAKRDDHKIVGIQVLGKGAVDKITDVAVTGIYAGLALEDYNTMDFSYAPPFSTAIHPFVQACYILENKLNGTLDTFTPLEYLEGMANDYKVIDVQSIKTIRGADFMSLRNAEEESKRYQKDDKLLLVCTKAKRAYFLQNKLKHLGFTKTKVLEGGVTVNDVKA